jgi:hypothetical protein
MRHLAIQTFQASSSESRSVFAYFRALPVRRPSEMSACEHKHKLCVQFQLAQMPQIAQIEFSHMPQKKPKRSQVLEIQLAPSSELAQKTTKPNTAV